MIEKISGVDAKNVEIAKDKDTDIDTIVNNLQRNITKERDDGKARGMTEADLTAMYGEPIDIATGDDIFGAELIGMNELEDDSPLNAPGTFVPPEDRVPTPIRETRTEAPGDETAADDPEKKFTPIRLDSNVGEEGIFDLTGSVDPSDDIPAGSNVSAFQLDPNETYFDTLTGEVITPLDIQALKQKDALDIFRMPRGDYPYPSEEFDAAVQSIGTPLPDIDVTQEQPSTLFNTTAEGERDLTRNPVPGQAVINGVGLVYADGSPIMDRTAQGTALTGERNPTPLFDSDIDEEAIRRAIEGKANGGQIFGNQNMSTFDKLKAIADGIADNK